MSADLTQQRPLPFDPTYEVVEENENETREQLIKTLRGIAETTFKDEGHALRGVHAKSHGVIKGEIRILDDLPPELAQGLFATPRRLPVIMRLSTIPGDLLDDRVSVPRGLALKIVGVEGARVAGSEGDVTQDFVLVNGPAFAAPGPKKFLGNLKLLAATTDKAPGLKKALSAVFRGVEKTLEAAGGESGTLKALGGHPETHILGETFYSQAPILYGRYMAKVCLAPVSSELRALSGRKVDLHDRPNGLRDAVVAFFQAHTAEWELRVQLCTDLEKMPIEDASVVWPETLSPYIAVARVVASPQQAWSVARVNAVDDGMAFSPWHALAAHRPLGAVMRVRRAVYEMSAQFRAQHNGKRTDEPRTLADLPD